MHKATEAAHSCRRLTRLQRAGKIAGAVRGTDKAARIEYA